MEFEPVIGLEIHAQLLTETKIFCGCRTTYGSAPNTNVCPVCLGLPGALPVLNERAVELAVTAALALGCQVQTESVFARKNYFYPDLPKGYQISQYERPLATEGLVEYVSGGVAHRVGIIRVHLEEDAGKSVHEGFPDSDRKTYVDFNRSGVPLIEIVTHPDLRSAAEAAEFFERLRAILVTLRVTDGNMEQGSLRCDANVSVRPIGQPELGVKTEVKNLNSFKFLEKALEYEIGRQIKIRLGGGEVRQETRLWNPSTGRTLAMRSKEEAHDYRYFPEPDLPPVRLTPSWIEEHRRALPELPEARKQRFRAQYDLSESDAALLSQSEALGRYFETVARESANPKAACNWMMGELARKMNELGLTIAEVPLAPASLAGLIRLIDRGTISSAIAKRVFELMYGSDRSPEQIVETEGLAQIDDEASLASTVHDVVAKHPGPVGQYRAGKTGALGFLVGQVMKATAGKANPTLVNTLLKRELDEPS